MNDQQINYKAIIKKEYIKCSADAVYFLTNYCKIQHPIRGTIPFDLYDFQTATLNDLIKNNYNIILKSRQLGISTLTAGYALWLMLFQNDKNILVIATNQSTAKNLVLKVKTMYKFLPDWLKTDLVENNQLSLRFTNGSQIKAIGTSPIAGRSEALSLLILDEAAHMPYIDEIWAASQNTLATGGRCIVLSTPNGIGNWFHRTWIKAEAGENDFNFIKLPWYIHPERDQEWRNNQTKLLGKRMASQECLSGDCMVEIYNNETQQEEIMSLEEIYNNL